MDGDGCVRHDGGSKVGGKAPRAVARCSASIYGESWDFPLLEWVQQRLKPGGRVCVHPTEYSCSLSVQDQPALLVLLHTQAPRFRHTTKVGGAAALAAELGYKPFDEPPQPLAENSGYYLGFFEADGNFCLWRSKTKGGSYNYKAAFSVTQKAVLLSDGGRTEPNKAGHPKQPAYGHSPTLLLLRDRFVGSSLTFGQDNYGTPISRWYVGSAKGVREFFSYLENQPSGVRSKKVQRIMQHLPVYLALRSEPPGPEAAVALDRWFRFCWEPSGQVSKLLQPRYRQALLAEHSQWDLVSERSRMVSESYGAFEKRQQRFRESVAARDHWHTQVQQLEQELERAKITGIPQRPVQLKLEKARQTEQSALTYLDLRRGELEEVRTLWNQNLADWRREEQCYRRLQEDRQHYHQLVTQKHLQLRAKGEQLLQELRYPNAVGWPARVSDLDPKPLQGYRGPHGYWVPWLP